MSAPQLDPKKLWDRVTFEKALKFGIVIDGIRVGINENHANYYNSLYNKAVEENKEYSFKSLLQTVHTMNSNEAADFIQKYNSTRTALEDAAQ